VKASSPPTRVVERSHHETLPPQRPRPTNSPSSVTVAWYRSDAGGPDEPASLADLGGDCTPSSARTRPPGALHSPSRASPRCRVGEATDLQLQGVGSGLCLPASATMAAAPLGIGT